MAEIINMKSRAREYIFNNFPPSNIDEIPEYYEIKTIEYMKEKIDEYAIIFWHRLLNLIYGGPLEIECCLLHKDINKKRPDNVFMRNLGEKTQWRAINITEEIALKIDEGELKPLPENWKYFIDLPSGGKILIGTQELHSILYLAFILLDDLKDEDIKNAEKFITLILDEADKEKHRLFNPEKEFEKSTGIQSYMIFNDYLSNYTNAEVILSIACDNENMLQNEFQKYNILIYYDDPSKVEDMERYMCAIGVFFQSVIIYYFMALEAFINIVSHSFLKKNIRDSDMNIEKRFDIEMKLRLLPILCDGFMNEKFDVGSEIFSNFAKLTDYRNKIFHSRIYDSLKRFNFVEDGFLYILSYPLRLDQIQGNLRWIPPEFWMGS